MKARSLVFDLFGDYLRYRGGEVRLRHLVALMACFDIPEPTVRVVATRLRKEGWLSSRREGRETIYALTETAWELLDEGRDRIFNRARGPWDGQWHMVIYSVPEAERALREQLRKKLAWFGFGPLSASVWLSPHDRAGDVLKAFADEPSVRLDVFRSQSKGPAEDRDIASRAWDLGELDRDYVELLHDLRPRLARGAVAGTQIGILEIAPERLGEVVNRTRADQPARDVIIDQALAARRGGGDHRQAAGHRL